MTPKGDIKMRKKISLNLTKKLMIFSILLLFIPTIMLGIISYYEAKKQLDDAGKKELQNSVGYALTVIDELDQKVKNKELSLTEAQNIVIETFLGKKSADGLRIRSDKIKLGKFTYMFINSKDGYTLYHPDSKNDNRPSWNDKDKDGKYVTREIIKNGLKGGGFTTYKWTKVNSSQITDKIVYSAVDPHWGWIVSAGAFMDDYNAGANSILHTLMLILGVALVLGMVASYILIRKLISIPITGISSSLEKLADGQLNLDLVKVKAKDEIGSLATSFNRMVVYLRDLVTQVNHHSQIVAASSEELTANSEETSHATEQIASTVQGVMSGVDKQVHNVEETAQTLNEISFNIQQIAQNAQNVTTTAFEATDKALEGGETIQTAVKQMASIKQTVNGLSELIKHLGDRSQEINQMSVAITEIASQTNLLSLNASIEAARAGEHGRGFAVVADEIQKLAEQSSDSAKQISHLISAIQEETQHAIESMGQATQEVETGIQTVHTAGVSFGNIEQAIKGVSSQINQVSEAVQEMVAGAENVKQSMNIVKEISLNTSEGTQEVSAATEEQLAAIEEIASSANTLTKMSEELRQLVNQFKL